MKVRTTITFEVPTTHLRDGLARELRTFIVDALETWGGQRHPDDWLFHSLYKVNVSRFERADIPRPPKEHAP